MGAAISAVLITSGMNPILSILLAGVGGMIAGAVTGWIHTKLKNSCIIGWYFDNDCFVLCEPSHYGQS